MAFSITYRKSHQLPLGELNHEQFLVLAIEAAQRSDWSVGHTTPHGFSAYTGFSLSSFSEEVTVKLLEDRAIIESECVGTQLYDWGKNRRNLREFEATFEEVKAKFTPEALAERYKLLQEENDFTGCSETPGAGPEAKTNFFSLFIPAGGYFITPILLNLNLLVFLIMVCSGIGFFQPNAVSLIDWGANYQPRTLGGEWWRLLTSTFLHFGIVHLLMNMYALVYVGGRLEPLLGRSRFLLAYLVTGIGASLVSVYWHPLAVCAGASGAIFGLYGLFLALLLSNYIERSARRAFLISITIFVGYNLLNGMEGNTDNAAHTAGLLAGMALGFGFLQSLKYPNDRKLQQYTLGVTTLLFLVLSITVYLNLPNTVKIFKEKMERFTAMEAMALEVYNLPQTAAKEEILNEITQRGFYYWNENLKILDELDELRLPAELKYQNKLTRKYVELRIKSYELIFQIVKEENPEPYEKLLNQYNAQVEGLRQRIR